MRSNATSDRSGYLASPAQPSTTKPTLGDVWGAVAATLVVVPSSIAYGVSTYAILGKDYIGTGVLAGLFGAIATGLLSSPLGGTPRLISSPCGPATTVLSAFAAQMMATPIDGHPMAPARIAMLMTMVALVSAALQFLYGLAGGGKLIKFIPYPVVAGFSSAVGVVLFASQIPEFLGFSGKHGLISNVLAPEQWQWRGIMVGLVTVAGILSGPKLTKSIPALFLGLGAGLLAYFGLGLAWATMLHQAGNRLLLGPVGGGLAAILPHCAEQWKSLASFQASDWKLVLIPALTLSSLLSIDTLKTCVIVDARTRSRHDSNRTLIGQGVGNVVSALVGGVPGAGMSGATVASLNSGARTRWSGFFEGCLVLLAFVLCGSLLGWLPRAALAGILMVVAVKMFDWTSFHLLRDRSTLLDFIVVWAVVAAAVRYNLIVATAAGLGLAALIFLREQVRSPVLHRKFYGNEISSKKNRLPAEAQILETLGKQIVICELQGNLFFGTADRLYVELEPDLKQGRFIIVDMRRVRSVDFTAAHTLELMEFFLRERGAFLLFSHMPATLTNGQNLEAYFHQVGVTDRQENVKLFAELDEAMAWAEDRLLDEQHMLADENAQALLDLGEIDLFSGIARQQGLADLAACATLRPVPAGSAIFRTGESGDELFLIRRGAVRIELPVGQGRHRTLAWFGRGNFFGEMGFLDQRPRSADAVATVATDLFVVRRSRFDEICRERPILSEIVLGRLATALAVRLRRTNLEFRRLHDA